MARPGREFTDSEADLLIRGAAGIAQLQNMGYSGDDIQRLLQEGVESQGRVVARGRNEAGQLQRGQVFKPGA